MEHCDILIIGAGAAGISAAAAAKRDDEVHVCMVDANPSPGGVLRQCFHQGFGEGLSGPAYIDLLLNDFPSRVDYRPQTTVLSLEKNRLAHLCAPHKGSYTLAFRQLVFAAGCYNIPIGALCIAGTRPKGIYTAGQMQARMNLYQQYPEGPVAILGSGDLGLLMAAQIAALEIPVTLIEQRSQCGGLLHNQACLRSPYVQLYCQTTIERICGDPTLEGVVLSNGNFLPCHTLLTAVGLCPERTLIEPLEAPSWLCLAGNCHRVQSMIERVIEDGKQAGLRAYTQWRNEK